MIFAELRFDLRLRGISRDEKVKSSMEEVGFRGGEVHHSDW